MIYRGQTGTGMTALINYLTGEGRDEHRNLKLRLPGEEGRATLLGGFNFGFEPKTPRQADIARRMMEFYASPEMQGGKNKYCAKDAEHISLSWHKGYAPSVEEKMRAAREVLAARGLQQAMALVYDHDDKGPHIHIAVSRVDKATGMAIDDHQSRYKGMAWALDWEERNAQITPPRLWQHGLRNLTRGEDWSPVKLKEHLLENEATIPRHTLDLAIALGGNFGDDLEHRRQRVVEDNNLLRLRRWKNQRLPSAYTTREIWAEENKTIAAARRLHERDSFQVPEEVIQKYAKRFKLTEQQEQAFRHATGPQGFAMLAGQAGVGKSRVLSATRMAYEEIGFNVRGNAHTHQVVQLLEKDGFKDAATISSDVERLKRGRSPWRGPTVVIPDEAAQLDTPDQLYRLFGFASRTPNIKVIPAGDYRQIGSIKRGGLHRPLEQIFGAAEMTEIMRTQDPELKAAMSAMHEREWPKVVKILDGKGAIHWSKDLDASINALADRYMEDLAKDPEASRLVMTLTNDNAARLNKEIRKRIRALQETPSKQMKLDTARGPVMFGVGDRVVLNETAFSPEDKAKGLTNGAFGQVIDLQERDDGRRIMTMKLDRARKQQQRVQSFPVGPDREASEMFDVSHGYASTNFKAQGKTVDYGYGLQDPRGTAPGNYVQASRMARKFYLGVNREDTHDIIELGKQLGHGPDKTAAHAYRLDPEDCEKLNQEKEKAMAKRRTTTGRPRVTGLGQEYVKPSERPRLDAIAAAKAADQAPKNQILRDRTEHDGKAMRFFKAAMQKDGRTARRQWEQQRDDETVQQHSDRLDANTHRSKKDIDREDEFQKRQDKSGVDKLQDKWLNFLREAGAPDHVIQAEIKAHSKDGSSHSRLMTEAKERAVERDQNRAPTTQRDDTPPEVARNFRRSADASQAKREADNAAFKNSVDTNRANREAAERRVKEAEDTLRKFGYDEKIIGSIGAGTKQDTAAMLNQAYPAGPPVQKVRPGLDIDGLMNDPRSRNYRESFRETAKRWFGSSHSYNPEHESQNNLQDRTTVGGKPRKSGEVEKGNLRGQGVETGDKRDETNATQRQDGPKNWFGFRRPQQKTTEQQEENPMTKPDDQEIRKTTGKIRSAMERMGLGRSAGRSASPKAETLEPERDTERDQQRAQPMNFMDHVHQNLGTSADASHDIGQNRQRKRDRDDLDRGRGR